jgi:hypothetical protein
VGPRAGLDDVEKRKFLTLPDSNSDPSVVHTVASRYPGSFMNRVQAVIIYFVKITKPCE